MTKGHPVEPRPEQKRRHWITHIKSWRKSGLSQVAYCREHGLKLHQFTYWKKMVQQKDGDIAFVPLRFSQNLPAVINSSRIQLTTPNGYKLELNGFFDQVVVRQLLHTVRSL
jgi:transposase